MLSGRTSPWATGGRRECEMIERRCDRRKPGQDDGDREPRIPLLAEEPPEVRSLDPVHDQDVPIIDEEVATHRGKRRVGLQAEQGPTVAKEGLAVVLHGERSNTQRHGAVVLVVHRPQDLGLLAVTEVAENLVAAADQVRHPPSLRST